MTTILKTLTNQKALATNQDPLIRRPVESNHTPQSGAIRISSDDRIRPVSTSPNLRNLNYISEVIKNNTPIREHCFGFADGSVTSLDTRYLYYIKP